MSKRPKKALPPAVVQNTTAPVKNGLADALGLGGGPFGAMGLQGAPWTPTISTAETIFKNLRYYLVSNFRQVLSEAYVEIGLIQTIVDVPVDDALRGGLEIKSKQLSEENIEELKTHMEHEDDLTHAGQAGKWNRLFGGGGLLILTDQDPEEPLRIESIGDDLEFRAVDMWELYGDQQNVEMYDALLGDNESEFFNYYGYDVHKSRVLKLKGLVAPSFIRPRLRGWGFSVVEKLVRSLNQYLKSTDLTFEVLDEFKLDIFKMKNLISTLLSPQGEDKVRQRVQMANMQKNYQNALVMDSEDEYDHKQLSFTGLAEVMEGIRIQVASDMRMPLTKLFGMSAAGFNSGEDDIEVYNGMVESEVRTKLKYPLLRMAELRCQQLFGYIPDDLQISWKPLRILGAVEEETVKTQKYTRAIGALQAGVITATECREAINKGNLLDISLDAVDERELAVSADDDGASEDDTDADTDGEGSGDAGPGAAASRGPKAVKNDVKPFTTAQLAIRTVTNSAAFDRASYAADGGDDWIDSRRKEFFSNPGNVDEALWDKAKKASQDAFGSENWKFIEWWYRKQGGKH